MIDVRMAETIKEKRAVLRANTLVAATTLRATEPARIGPF
jgi:hypothetical protein